MKTLAVGVLLAALAAWAWIHEGWRPPDRWNPWAPLSLDEPPGWLTRFKLSRLDQDAPACLATLRRSEARFEPLPDREYAPGCGLENAVRISRLGVAVSSPFTLSCRAAVSLALWERHTLQPAAQAHLGEPVIRLDHLGSYACRNVYGREAGARSQHATADALDVSAVGLRSGRRVSVLKDWDRSSSPADGRFLRALRDGACGMFDGVFSPDYNAAHADHLHLDRGPYRVCR